MDVDLLQLRGIGSSQKHRTKRYETFKSSDNGCSLKLHLYNYLMKKRTRLERNEAEAKLENELRRAGKEYKRAKSQAENCQRYSAIGMDRNFSRYWFFGSLVPGLYVEKSKFEFLTSYV
ncbi:hypothetical protein D918_08651 [Trichuris suis]|nr:hypothetical protein D918_08651 [Trichuris suis]